MEKKSDNVVKISDPFKIEKYTYSILERFKPMYYKKYGCILVNCPSSLNEFTKTILRNFRWAGLKQIKKEERKSINVEKPDGTRYIMNDCYEFTLKKVPVLEMIEEEQIEEEEEELDKEKEAEKFGYG